MSSPSSVLQGILKAQAQTQKDVLMKRIGQPRDRKKHLSGSFDAGCKHVQCRCCLPINSTITTIAGANRWEGKFYSYVCAPGFHVDSLCLSLQEDVRNSSFSTGNMIQCCLESMFLQRESDKPGLKCWSLLGYGLSIPNWSISGGVQGSSHLSL